MKVFGMVSMRCSAAYTAYALQSFFKCTPLDPGDRFYLIDNDGSVDPIGLCSPAITLIRNAAPLGFAANVNQVIRLARPQGADVFFLNNDIIFTPNWLAPLTAITEPAIVSPLSNSQAPYRAGAFDCRTALDLSDYLGHESVLQSIALEHSRRYQGLSREHMLYFFCVKIPYAVYNTVGELDESFGRGGAEDADYCLRCHQADIPVCYAQQSFVLHFAGKSTWRGGETQPARLQRERFFRNVFTGKWGTDLTEITLDSNYRALDSNPPLREAFSMRNFRHIVDALRMPLPELLR